MKDLLRLVRIIHILAKARLDTLIEDSQKNSLLSFLLLTSPWRFYSIEEHRGERIRKALEEAGKADQVRLIGFDGQIEGKQAIKDGEIFADPIQFPDQMAILTMQNIQKYLDGEEFEKVNLITPKLYKKADADQDPDLQ